jgi:hypothetical protein
MTLLIIGVKLVENRRLGLTFLKIIPFSVTGVLRQGGLRQQHHCSHGATRPDLSCLRREDGRKGAAGTPAAPLTFLPIGQVENLSPPELRTEVPYHYGQIDVAPHFVKTDVPGRALRAGLIVIVLVRVSNAAAITSRAAGTPSRASIGYVAAEVL